MPERALLSISTGLSPIGDSPLMAHESKEGEFPHRSPAIQKNARSHSIVWLGFAVQRNSCESSLRSISRDQVVKTVMHLANPQMNGKGETLRIVSVLEAE